MIGGEICQIRMQDTLDNKTTNVVWVRSFGKVKPFRVPPYHAGGVIALARRVS